MASIHPPPSKVVNLFSRREPETGVTAGRAQVVRAFAEATQSLGRAAELLDGSALDADTKLPLIRGVKELVIRTFNLNAAYMEAESATFRLRGHEQCPGSSAGEPRGPDSAP